MDWDLQNSYNKRGVMMRVHPDFRAFCEEKSSEYGIPQTDFTNKILKRVKSGFPITWI